MNTIASYKYFVDTMPDAVLLVNSSGKIVVANSSVSELFGYGQEMLIGREVDLLVPVSIKSGHEKYVRNYFKNPKKRALGSSSSELTGINAAGEEVPIDIMLGPIYIGEELFALCVVRDMTQLRKTQRALKSALRHERELARHDHLTSAVNRRYFFDLLQREIDCYERAGRNFSLAYIDLDNFKTVNDTFGHQMGDRVLAEIVDTMKSILRKSDVVARIGGDEFALLFSGANRRSEKKIIDSVQKALSKRMAELGQSVTFSIGVVSYHGGQEDAEELVKRADNLMYKVKHNGKDAAAFEPQVVREEMLPIIG